MWTRDWRERLWSSLDLPWDLIVVGGGITGAGILREAAHAGLRVLMVEANDFASGTSSRSSKLVHGGLRYLRSGQIRMTWQSIRQRERLLREGAGLVKPLRFLMPLFKHDRASLNMLGVGLTLFDLLALKWDHRRYGPRGLHQVCPLLEEGDLKGGYAYLDAKVDDARLVLRLIREAVQAGAQALNYARVSRLLRTRDGAVRGVALRDGAPGANDRETEVEAPLVVNATGPWADDLRAQLGAGRRLRRLRGSHLVFSRERLPLEQALSILHPQDARPVFAIPWEGVTLFGTTDIDHEPSMQHEPRISTQECEYLLQALQEALPSLELSLGDVQATFAGIRAVVDTGKANPSRESREHVLWQEKGLLTVTGGKLTTFGLMAQEALRAASSRLPGQPRFRRHGPALEVPSPEAMLQGDLDPALRARLLGRYGAEAADLLATARPPDLERIAGTPALWGEVRWAAESEGVVHLDDLMLRRTRLGILLPDGGLPWIERIRPLAQPALGWDDERWASEAEGYARLWRACYARPGAPLVAEPSAEPDRG